MEQMVGAKQGKSLQRQITRCLQESSLFQILLCKSLQNNENNLNWERIAGLRLKMKTFPNTENNERRKALCLYTFMG